MSLFLFQDNVTPFTSQQCNSLLGCSCFIGAPACDSSLEEVASDYSSTLVLLEILPANYSYRMPNAKPSKIIKWGRRLA
jgi:hypothetical protein